MKAQQSRNNHAIKNIQDIVDKHYDEMFDEVIEITGDNLHELSVEIITLDGLSVRRSWLEREVILREENRE
jgi:hypothetical protein